MGAQSLQRVAEAGDRVPVVEKQSRAALLGQPRREFEHEAVRDGADLEHRTVVGLRVERRLRFIGDVEGEFARAVETHHPLAPLPAAPLELLDRQRVEELVGEYDRRTVRRLGEAPPPGDRRAGGEQRVVLDLGERRARLDQRDVERGAELGDDARGAQRIAHQSAAARAKLDHAHRIGPPHRRPHFRRPQADEFAEHLRDFRRGGEIAVGPERVARHVVAVLRIGERELHEALDRDRPALGEP